MRAGRAGEYARGDYALGDPDYDNGCIDENAMKAINAVTDVLAHMSHVYELSLETGSVYGSAMALPQIARSSHYNNLFCVLAFRSYILLVINIVVQVSLLIFIGQSTNVMSALGGQMHLCDFGAPLVSCPGVAGCTGPGGTEFTKTRLYSYEQWNIQNFVKQALLSIVPEKSAEIRQKVDPGEYGLENYMCRLVCCFIFTMSVVQDLFRTCSVAYLLYKIPTKAESWIRYVPPSDVMPHRIRRFFALGCFRYCVAGMPLSWKVTNIVTILVPKMALWYWVAFEGFRLLMDTAGIVDLVLGCMAMGFVLNIDEMVFQTFASDASVEILARCEGYVGHLQSEEAEPDEPGQHSANEADEDVLDRLYKEGYPLSTAYLIKAFFPTKLVAVSLIMVIFVVKYYYLNCDRSHDGSFVSKPMYMPKTTSYGIMEMITGQHEIDSRPFWTMPAEV